MIGIWHLTCAYTDEPAKDFPRTGRPPDAKEVRRLMEMAVVTLRGGRAVLELSLQAGRVAPGRPPAVVQQNLELIWEDDPCAELGCAGCPGGVHAGVSLRLRPDKDGDSGGKHQGLPVPPLSGIGPFRGCHLLSRGEKNSLKRRPRPKRGATTGAWTESPHKRGTLDPAYIMHTQVWIWSRDCI